MYFPFNPRGFQIGDIIKKKKKQKNGAKQETHLSN